MDENKVQEEKILDLESEIDEFLDDFSGFLEEENEKYDEDFESMDELLEREEEYDSLSDYTESDEDAEEEELSDEDDHETAILRYETAQIALGLMNYVEYNVVTLENELTILGDAFNQLLDKTRQLDDRISLLSDKVNKARLEGAREAIEFIHTEIKLISDNLEGAIKSTDPSDKEVLEENVVILTENKYLIEHQIKGLKEIGSDTTKLENDLKVLESSIIKLRSAINSNEIFSLSSIIASEITQVIGQINESRKAEDEEDIALLQENFDLLMDNRSDLEEKLWELDDKGTDIDMIKEQFDVLNINLEQFSRTIDDTIYHLSISTKPTKK